MHFSGVVRYAVPLAVVRACLFSRPEIVCPLCDLDVSRLGFYELGVMFFLCFFACAPCIPMYLIWEDVGMCKSDFKIHIPIGQ